MRPNQGDEFRDVSLFLGYPVEITEDGALAANLAVQILRRKAVLGAVE